MERFCFKTQNRGRERFAFGAIFKLDLSDYIFVSEQYSLTLNFVLMEKKKTKKSAKSFIILKLLFTFAP